MGREFTICVRKKHPVQTVQKPSIQLKSYHASHLLWHHSWLLPQEGYATVTIVDSLEVR